MTVGDIFDYYSNSFLPIYARAVAELQDKPVQITVEIENAFSHLAVHSMHLKDGNVQKQIDHLKKAQGHIERATLDAYKFIWISLLKKTRIFDRPGILEFATKIDLHEAVRRHEVFKSKANEARVKELSNLEESASARNEFYRDAVESADILFECLDAERLRRFRSYSIWYLIKSNSVAFALGVIAGVAGNFATDAIKSRIS